MDQQANGSAAAEPSGSGSPPGEVFYAHSTDRPDESDWQLLRDHLHGVGELAASSAVWFGGAALARIAGLLHDLGKYTRAFQLRLHGRFGKVDHATAGARVARERYRGWGRLLAYGIAGHHAGLANGAFDAEAKRTALQDRLAAKPEHTLLPHWEREFSLPPDSELAPDGFRRSSRNGFQQAMLGRMLFSCLVDADYIDTENFYLARKGRFSARDEAKPTLEALRERLDHFLGTLPAEGGINALRGQILAHVRRQSVLEPGLFSLTVPTGGGKTLASLAFALDHAIAHGLRRVIYVIPFTSIVEQNAAVFRQALGDLGEAAVLEHHSAYVDDPCEAREGESKIRLAMENWDAPIVVTTSVQFFESLFADRPSRCRKLHNITASVVVLDEAQTLPQQLLLPSLAAIEELALNYRASLVLCTATQPGLTKEADFHDGLAHVRELAPEPKALYQRLKRVVVRHIGQVDDARLIEELRSRDQVLCIVNNRRHARALFEGMAGQPGAYHLSTLMCAKHRSEVLARIRDDLANGRPCRLVSTSLIEAGVDVDFATVLRAEAGLDSIAQAAGRCNRNGRMATPGEVLVFAQDSEDWAPPPELRIFAQVFREIHRKHADDPLSLDAIADYFAQLYWQKGAKALDEPGLMELLAKSDMDSLPFEALAAKYRVIENAQFPVIVPYDDAAREALERLEFAEGCGKLARRLQPYLVQLPRQGYLALLEARAIEPVQKERYGDQFMRLTNPDLYRAELGLGWADPVFLAAERLIG